MIKNVFNILPILAVLCLTNCDSNTTKQDAQSASMLPATAAEGGIEEKLTEMNITLPDLPAPTASYVRSTRSGNLIFLSGHGPMSSDGKNITGKIGKDLTTEEGKQAARKAAITLLSALKESIGDLDKVTRIIKVHGMVNSIPDYTEHSTVMNGCSDLLVELFGDKGKHARAAVGMGSLPGNMAVEIEMVVEVSE